jgi:hypothetical protein
LLDCSIASAQLLGPSLMVWLSHWASSLFLSQYIFFERVRFFGGTGCDVGKMAWGL